MFTVLYLFKQPSISTDMWYGS